MFSNKSRYLFKTFKKSHPFMMKATFPILSYTSNKNLETFLSIYKISLSSFSSFPQNLHQINFKEDLILLENFSRQQLTYASTLMDKYAQCEDFDLLTSHDVEWISSVLFSLAHIHKDQGNNDKARQYLIEHENLHREKGIRDTLDLAQNYYLQSSIYLQQDNLINADHYLSEVDRICRLLVDNQEARSLMLQGWCSFAELLRMQNDHDQALQLYNSVLERKDDILEAVKPSLLISVYQGMGSIYSSMSDLGKAIDSWANGLELALHYFGENSNEAYFFYDQITKSLYNLRGQDQKALSYAKKALQIALEIFSKDSIEVGTSYIMLGHLYVGCKEETQALKSYHKAIKIFENTTEDYSIVLYDVYFQIIKIHCLQENFQEARIFLGKASQAFIKAHNENDPIIAEEYSKWARELKKFKNMKEESKDYFCKALKIYEVSDPRNNEAFLRIYAYLSGFAFREQDWSKACELFKECEKYFDVVQLDPFLRNIIYEDLASSLIHLQKFDEAEKYVHKVLQSSQEMQQIGDVYYKLGIIYEQRGMFKEAVEVYKKAVESEEQNIQKDDLRIRVYSEKIVEIERKLNATNEAVQ